MKRNLIFILILLTLFTTGCSVNYNLEIKDETLIETTIYTEEENSLYTKDYMYSQYQEEHPIYFDEEYLYYAPNEKIEGNTYYEKSIKENTNGYTATYKATYDLDEFKRARSLNIAYENYSIGYNNNEDCYIIMANNFKLFKTNEYLTDVTININLKDYEVIESNHDRKNGTTYTWLLDKNDSSNNIILKYKDNNKANNHDILIDNDKTNEIKPDYTIYIFYGILILLILLGYLIFKKLKEKNNNFDDD